MTFVKQTMATFKIQQTISLKPVSASQTMNDFQCEKCLNLYTTLYRYMSSFIVEWNGTTVFTKGATSRKYYWFYVNFCGVLGLVSSVPSFYILLHTKSVPQTLIYTTLQTQTVSILCSFLLLNWISNLDTFVYKFRCMKLLNLRLYRQLNYSQLKASYPSTAWTTVAYFLNLLIIILFIIPLVLTTARTMHSTGNKDPLGWTVINIFKTIEAATCPANTNTFYSFYHHKVLHGFAFTLQFILVYIRTAENCRFIAIFFVLFLYWLELQQRCLKILKILARSKSSHKLEIFKLYTAWRLAHLHECFSVFVSILMSIGFAIFVVCNIVTLRCFKVMPSWKIYIHFPIVSMITGFFVKILLTFITRIYIDSRNIIDLEMEKCLLATKATTSYRLRWWYNLGYRFWKSACPVIYSCGHFFKLKQGLELLYLNLVMIRTLDGLLLINTWIFPQPLYCNILFYIFSNNLFLQIIFGIYKIFTKISNFQHLFYLKNLNANLLKNSRIKYIYWVDDKNIQFNIYTTSSKLNFSKYLITW